MIEKFRTVNRCPLCNKADNKPFVKRTDGVDFLRCMSCNSLYLATIPSEITNLYSENYFGLQDEHAHKNADNRVGYESSYSTGHLDSEFYWAFRLADQVGNWVGLTKEGRHCLDIGAATGCLLNIFSASGYKTSGVELSTPARQIASSSGHKMHKGPFSSSFSSDEKYDIITALEVIEHIEDLPDFFSAINNSLNDQGIFIGYFPSADDTAFQHNANYHWLHSSFEHLVYPTEKGMLQLLRPIFGENIFMTTFFTRQGPDVIPNTIIIVIKGQEKQVTNKNIIELFRQLSYINDRQSFFANMGSGAGALTSAWESGIASIDHTSNIAYLAGLLCAKFGNTEAALLFLTEQNQTSDINEVACLDHYDIDCLVIAMHCGSIDWLREQLAHASPNTKLSLILRDCANVVERYDSSQSQMASDQQN